MAHFALKVNANILTLNDYKTMVNNPAIPAFDRLAHVDRASASGAEGGGFESRVCQKK